MRKSIEENPLPKDQSQMIRLANKTEGERQFKISDVVYCASENTKVNVWLVDGTCFSVTANLTDFEMLLCQYDFVRIQQSYLINVAHVDTVRRAERDIVMKFYPRVEISASRDNGRWLTFISAWERGAIWPSKKKNRAMMVAMR